MNRRAAVSDLAVGVEMSSIIVVKKDKQEDSGFNRTVESDKRVIESMARKLSLRLITGDTSDSLVSGESSNADDTQPLDLSFEVGLGFL